ncbi:LamG domain-containing protein [Nocardioides dubius]|uniref:Laminin G domain-containing protein n=1 Tax=Nocardioides dubius TaxID=317019 RepID=A0ABN1TLC8_9ACTN
MHTWWGGSMALVLSLSACAGASSGAKEQEPAATEASSNPQALFLDFEELTAEYDSVVPSVQNLGSASVRTAITTFSGGRVRLTPSPGGVGVRFPAWGDGSSAAAALVVWDQQDALSPGEKEFRFGAQVMLDPESEGSSSDNGDNLMQRGLFTDETQVKIQLDHGVPSCRVAGDGGELLAKAETAVERGRWYSVDCERNVKGLRLRVKPVEKDGGEDQVVSVRGKTGQVQFPASVPLSVGAKVGPDGALMPSTTDQFNGAVDDVFFDVVQ